MHDKQICAQTELVQVGPKTLQQASRSDTQEPFVKCGSAIGQAMEQAWLLKLHYRLNASQLLCSFSKSLIEVDMAIKAWHGNAIKRFQFP